MVKSRANPYLFFGLWSGGVAIFCAFMAYAYFDTTMIEAYALGISVASLIVMGLDKSLASSGSLRVPEKVLYGLAALGGGGGIILGMHLFRHKTRKGVFQCALMLIFLVQVFIASKLR
jgi:uncharacterized membrane protein YsdA (DUF1294 family)